jgi:CheY-like chemotaxis protein
MTVTCPTCKATLTIPDEKLPKGKAVSAACPHCKGKIVIDLTTPGSAPGAVGGAGPAPDAAAEEAPASYGEQRQPLALVCVDDPTEREQVMAALRAQGYAPRAPASAADALQRLRFMAYALLVLRDGYGSAGGDGNPVLDHLAEMSMAARRLMHVVFVSPAVRSHDTAAAFAKSVNLVLHVNDLPHLPEALKRSREETDQTQRVLLESLRAQGKA